MDVDLHRWKASEQSLYTINMCYDHCLLKSWWVYSWEGKIGQKNQTRRSGAESDESPGATEEQSRLGDRKIH